jgi:hemolysin activation/secretion protein
MFRTSLLAALLLATSHAALAQQPPSAGQLQQIPPPPTADKPAPDLHIDAPQLAADAEPSGAQVRVDSLHVTGATRFSEGELIAATTFTPGAELTVPELRNMAAAIARYYNKRGYFLAQAYLPAQDIKAGSVTIAVLEGHYGAVSLRNTSTLSNRAAERLADGLEQGDLIAIAPLERRLLLLSDVPGVAVRSTLAPGAAVGTSDLTIDIAQGPRFSGSLEADNAGNRYTGAYRLGGSIQMNNPTGAGDQLSLRVLASTDGLAYGRAAYQRPLGDATIGLAYTHMRYELGKEFAVLNGSGTADIVSLFASYPLIRSRDHNLYALAGFDAKKLEDEIGLVSQTSNKKSLAANLGLRGDSHDRFGGGGWNAFSLIWTSGDLNIEDPLERAADAATAGTDGGFNKVQFSASRLQTLAGPLSLYGFVRGQIATDNLDSSEKMELGGAYGVRAYPEGEAYGDQGFIATVEAQLTLDRWTARLPGRFQLIGFIDAGQVDFAHDPWFPGSNHARRSGYGGGLSWAGPHGFFAKASYARKLGDQAATSAPDEDGRAWFQLSKLF